MADIYTLDEGSGNDWYGNGGVAGEYNQKGSGYQPSNDLGGYSDTYTGPPLENTGVFGEKAPNPNIFGGNTGISGYGKPGGVSTPSYGSNQTSQQFLLNLLHQGKSPQEAIDAAKQFFPNDSGLYYPDKNLIGLGGSYLGMSNPNDPGSWNATQRVGGGGGYFSDPLLQGYLNFGSGAIDQLMGGQGIHPVLQQAIEALMKMMNQGAPQLDQGSLVDYANTVHKRQGELNQPGWSPSQLDLMRTQISDPLEAQKEAARQQVIQRFAAKGMTPDSGIVQQALMDSDRGFQQMRTTGERNLASQEMSQDEARKNLAVQMGESLGQMGMSGAQANLQGQLAGRGQSMGAAGQLAGIGSDLQSEPFRNMMAASGIYGNMAQLPFQANANAIGSMNAINNLQTPDFESLLPMIQTLLGLSNQGEGVYQDGQNNTSNLWGTLGQAMPNLLSIFGSLFGGKGGGKGVTDSGGNYMGE
jgi:hypothetical protein